MPLPPPPPPPGLDRPVGTIWCVGRNYAEHARELGNEVPAEPVVFLKPASALLLDGGTLRLPPDSRRVDHEVELVISVGATPRMAVGIDFTARDLQQAAKEKGLPWASSKGRPGFAAVGRFVPLSLERGFSLSVNGVKRQEGRTDGMLWRVPRLLEWLDGVYGLREGDLVFTGTPAGVAPLSAGDRIEAALDDGSSLLRLTVA